MLSQTQIKLIKQLHHKRGREKNGLCLVEGEKLVQELEDKLLFTFTPADTLIFQELTTTQTPQAVAGVAKIPAWTQEDVESRPRILVLDGVQDPGNIGSILRLCQAFDASLLLVESADITSPKVVRSSAGAFFYVPWQQVKKEQALDFLESSSLPVYRLEKIAGAKPYKEATLDRFILIAGSEGSGITLNIKAPSLFIEHEGGLDSLNVAQAIAIILAESYTSR